MTHCSNACGVWVWVWLWVCGRAAGSTGYSLSCGAPLLAPSVQVRLAHVCNVWLYVLLCFFYVRCDWLRVSVCGCGCGCGCEAVIGCVCGSVCDCVCDLSLGANPASPSLSSLTHMPTLHLSMWTLAQGMMLTPICSASPLVPTLVPDDGFVTMKVSADHVPPHRFRRDSFSDMVRWLEGPKMGECLPAYCA